MRAFSLFPAQIFVVLFCDLLLAAGLYAGGIYLLTPDPLLAYLSDTDGIARVLLAVFSIIGGIYFNELYTAVRVRSRIALLLQLCHVFGLSLIIQTILAYLSPQFALPRRVVLLATVVGLPAFFLWRLAYSHFLWNLFGQQRVLLVGSGPLAQTLARLIVDNPDRGIHLAGYVGDPVPSAEMEGADYLGPFDQLSAIASEWKPDRVVVACSDRRDGGMPIEELLLIRHRGVPIEEGSRLYEVLCNRICSSEFRPSQFIFDQTLVHRPGSLALQSIYINLMALCGIALLSPFLLALSLLVKISTGGSVFQPVLCMGYRQIPFSLLRFRVGKVSNSNRVVLTGLGRFLRRTHLEFLPALFNLLRGEMAIVGPRPNRVEVAEELAGRIPFYEQRYSLRPGLTGWSQINMDEGEPADALVSLEYDLYYLKNMSLALDAYVLLHRLRRMLTID